MTTLAQRLQILKRKLKLRPDAPRNDVIHLGGRDHLAPLGVLTPSPRHDSNVQEALSLIVAGGRRRRRR